MVPSSPRPASGCSPPPNGDLPGRRVLGRVAGANGFGTGLPPAGVQGDVLNRSRLAIAVCVPLTSNLSWADAPGNVLLTASMTGPAERPDRERDADRRPPPVATRRMHGPDFVGQAHSAARRHRHRPWPLGSQTAFADDRIAERQRKRNESRRADCPSARLDSRGVP